MRSEGRIVFRSTDKVGNPDADFDSEFLENCFVDPGYLTMLEDCKRRESVLIGRTGSGKTALLLRVAADEENAIRFNPELLSLTHLVNSTILASLISLGVDLELFFDLLWRHVLAVEILRRRYHIETSDQQESFFARISQAFAAPSKRKALEYLRTWGDKFWIEADERVRDVTRMFEERVAAACDVSVAGLGAKLEAAAKEGQKERIEVVKRCENVIEKVQAAELARIVDLVKDCLDDEQQRYYVIVDKLDEGWVKDDDLKMALVRSLLATIRALSSVQNLKVLVALRWDIIDRAFARTQFSQQREKFSGLMVNLKWSRQNLTKALDERVSFLVRSKYAQSQPVRAADILPRGGAKRHNVRAVDFILDRVMGRPRDLILFMNACLKRCDDEPMITWSMIKQAEGEYSRDRLQNLGTEWGAVYPNLIPFAEALLNDRPEHFELLDITDEELLEIAVTLAKQRLHEDDLSKALGSYDETADSLSFKQVLFWAFYKVGLVGLRLGKRLKMEVSYDLETAVSPAELKEDTRVSIHPCFWRALGTRTSQQLSNGQYI